MLASLSSLRLACGRLRSGLLGCEKLARRERRRERAEFRGVVDHRLKELTEGVQTKLEAKGYDVGSADGLPGFKTRRSIGIWQAKNGKPATCFPDASLVAAIK